MSRFFDDVLEEEKKEIKKKIHIESSQKNTQKLSKKEKLFAELQTRVFDLEDDDSKKSEKNIKKFLSELKKYESSFIELPNFLKNFLLSDKVYVKGNKKVVDAFLGQYEGKKEDEVETEIKNIKIKENLEEDYKKEQKDFALIKVVDDLNLRKIKLDTFIEATSSNDLKIDALIVLLSTCVRLNDSKSLFGYLKTLSNYLENDKVRSILKNNLDTYLEKILFVDCDEYSLLLKKFRDVNRVVCDRRLLEHEFFEKNKITDSEFIDFKLLSAIFTGDIDIVLNILSGLKKYLAVKSNLNERIYNEIFRSSDELVIFEDQIFKRIIGECAKFTLSHRKYLHALVCFSYVTDKSTDVNLNLLCVILNDKIKDTNLFKDFLLRFRDFSNNPLLMPSFYPEIEMFRAFYLLHNFDVDETYKIIRKLCNFWDDKEVLAETCRSILLNK
uniref:Uncharacterized protein n=1 Tax=Nosema pernyi TaxID=1112939 RepID=X5DYN0_9MICR|nr:hypothetical protein NP_04H12 [Nosema pernyi]